jgi:hypothetical protein
VVIANALIIAVFVFFPPGVPREHVHSLNGHRRGRAARNLLRAIRARAPSDERGRLAVDLRDAACSGFTIGLPIAAFAIPVLIARILDEERTLSAELPGYDD